MYPWFKARSSQQSESAFTSTGRRRNVTPTHKSFVVLRYPIVLEHCSLTIYSYQDLWADWTSRLLTNERPFFGTVGVFLLQDLTIQILRITIHCFSRLRESWPTRCRRNARLRSRTTDLSWHLELGGTSFVMGARCGFRDREGFNLSECCKLKDGKNWGRPGIESASGWEEE